MAQRMRHLKIQKTITGRDDNSLQKYLTEIGKLPLITAEEEVDLAQRIKRGDAEALEQLVKANLRFVVSVAKQYQGKGLSLPDLISEGNLGLVKAAGRFDETRGFKFISYAVWWIRQSILQGISDQSRVVRLPLNQASLKNKIEKATQKLEQEHEREPTAEELQEALVDVSLENISASISRGWARSVSLDAPTHGDTTSTFYDIFRDPNAVSPEQVVTRDELRTAINHSLDMLTSREADVIRLYFGLNGKQPHTLEEIGQEFELTRERVRQIKEKAMRHLKYRNGVNKALRAYVE